MPKFDSDDLLLFGSLAILAFGASLVAAATTANPLLALGAGLVVFGLPAVLIIFMAASEEPE